MQWFSAIFDKVADKVGDKVGQNGSFLAIPQSCWHGRKSAKAIVAETAIKG